MKQSYAILIVIVAIVFVAFPTPHSFTRQEPYTEYETVTKTDLVYTLDCTMILIDDESLQNSWMEMEDRTKIVVNIESNEDVEVRLTGITSITESEPETFYHSTNNVHDSTFIRNDVSFEIYLSNPCWYCAEDTPWHGPSAFMTGNISAYHVYEEQVPVTKYQTVPYEEWLPWWMP